MLTHWLGLVADQSLLLLGAVLVVILLAAKEVGYYAARRSKTQRGIQDTVRTSVGVITGGMLALLAFLLAISLSIADRRYEERRAVVLAEANAIGTAWLRAGALDSEAGRTIQRLLADYTEVRVEAVKTAEASASVLERTGVLQEEIWTIAGTVARAAPTPISAQLLASLNETFDLALSERRAFSSVVPVHILRVLLWTSLFAVAAARILLGYIGIEAIHYVDSVSTDVDQRNDADCRHQSHWPGPRRDLCRSFGMDSGTDATNVAVMRRSSAERAL